MDDGLVYFPFPLRAGMIVRLMLPANLKMSEVRRLTAMMETLAADNPSQRQHEILSQMATAQQNIYGPTGGSPFGGVLSGLGGMRQDPAPEPGVWFRLKEWWRKRWTYA